MRNIFFFFLLVNSIYLFSQHSLVASYPFCGNADDISGNNFHGIINGAVPTFDRYGNANSALKFDGINDFIQVSHDSLFNFDANQNFTISLWIQTGANQALTSGNQRNIIIDKFYDSGSNTYGFPFSLRINNQNTVRNGKISAFRKDLNSCSNKPEALSDSLVNDSLWHHIAMVRYDSIIQVFIDGNLDTTVLDITSCATTNNFDLYIGSKGGTVNRGFFKGVIDDIKIYSSAMDSSMVQALICEDTYCAVQTICPGDSILFGGAYRHLPGMYADSFLNTSACDSIKVTELFIDSTTITTDSANICFGDSQLIFGKYQSQQGYYYDTIQNVVGCDSILELKLKVNPLPSKNSSLNICAGDSVLIGGAYVKQTGVYARIINNSIGCDTLDSISVTIQNVIANINQAGYNLYTNYFGGSYQWIECVSGQIIPGANTNQYTVIQSGSYAVIVTDNGCVDTSDCITIVLGGISQIRNMSVSIFPNPAKEFITIKSASAPLQSLLLMDDFGRVICSHTNLEDFEHNISIQDLPQGIYVIEVTSQGQGIIRRKIVVK